MNSTKTILSHLSSNNKNEGKLAIVLLAGIALGGILSNLFSSKNILKLNRTNSRGGKIVRIKDSYTEMSNRLAN
jgi:hypothetical protein